MLDKILNDQISTHTIFIYAPSFPSDDLVETMVTAPISMLLQEEPINNDLILAYCQRIYGKGVIGIGDIVFPDEISEPTLLDVNYLKPGLRTFVKFAVRVAMEDKLQIVGMLLSGLIAILAMYFLMGGR